MANLITILRFPVLAAVVLLLYLTSPFPRLISAVLIGVLILMDTLDGVVARARREVSLMGSVLDIMLDRVVELVLWIVYADLELVPVAIPIIYVVRGTVVDALRNMHLSTGTAPFRSLRTAWGQWLVASAAMRTTYGISKVVSFAGLALTHALWAYAAQGAVGANAPRVSGIVFLATSWIAVVICLARGLPVVLEALPVPGKQTT